MHFFHELPYFCSHAIPLPSNGKQTNAPNLLDIFAPNGVKKAPRCSASLAFF